MAVVAHSRIETLDPLREPRSLLTASPPSVTDRRERDLYLAAPAAGSPPLISLLLACMFPGITFCRQDRSLRNPFGRWDPWLFGLASFFSSVFFF